MDELHGPPPSDKFILPSTHDDTLFRKFPHLYFHGREITWDSIDYGSEPQPVTCPCCLTNVVTEIKSNPTENSNLLKCLYRNVRYILLFKSKQKSHYCPKCGYYLGSYKQKFSDWISN